jgi:predicted DNA-binding ribbon-helix-helix protein
MQRRPRERNVKSTIVKRSVVLNRQKTSVSLEAPFWNSMKEFALVDGKTMSQIVGTIDEARGKGNLSSAIRLFVLNRYRERNRNTPANGPSGDF